MLISDFFFILLYLFYAQSRPYGKSTFLVLQFLPFGSKCLNFDVTFTIFLNSLPDFPYDIDGLKFIVYLVFSYHLKNCKILYLFHIRSFTTDFPAEILASGRKRLTISLVILFISWLRLQLKECVCLFLSIS